MPDLWLPIPKSNIIQRDDGFNDQDFNHNTNRIKSV